MSNQAPIIDMQTPSGVPFQIKQYLNGAEEQSIRAAKNRAINKEVQITGGQQAVSLDYENMDKYEEEAKIRAAIVSVNGSGNDVYNDALALRFTDYKFILSEATKLLEDPTMAK